MKLFKIFVKDEKPFFDLIIAYREAIGVVDIKGLDKFLKNTSSKKIIFVSREEPTAGVKEFLEDIPWKDIVEFKTTEKIFKAVSKLRKQFEEKKVKVINLDEFGERPYQYDAC